MGFLLTSKTFIIFYNILAGWVKTRLNLAYVMLVPIVSCRKICKTANIFDMIDMILICEVVFNYNVYSMVNNFAKSFDQIAEMISKRKLQIVGIVTFLRFRSRII